MTNPLTDAEGISDEVERSLHEALRPYVEQLELPEATTAMLVGVINFTVQPLVAVAVKNGMPEEQALREARAARQEYLRTVLKMIND